MLEADVSDTGQCSFCLDRVQSINAIIFVEDKKRYQDIYECSKRYLQNEFIFSDSFDWSKSEGLLSPFCASCFKSAQRIHRTSQELEKLQEDLLRLIEVFKNEIYKRTSKNTEERSSQSLVQDVQLVVPVSLVLSSDDYIDNNDDIDCSHLQTDDVYEGCEVSSIKAEVENSEVGVKEEKNFLTNELDDFEFADNDFEVPLDSDPLEDQGPEAVLSSDDPLDGYWPRVILERLQFDKNGQLISFKVEPADAVAKVSGYNKRRLRRSKAFSQTRSSLNDMLPEGDNIENEKPFKCRICGKGFGSRKCVIQHEERHQTTRAHQCQTCGKRFRDKYNLKLHSRIHRADFPYGCLECGKRFKWRQSIIRHKAMHDGVTYPCDLCQKEFRKKSYVRIHKSLAHFKQRIEIKKRPCKTCGKLFRNLPSHEAKHESDNKWQKCPICNKMLKNKLGLHNHMKNHKEKRFACKLCDKTFPVARRLEGHIQQVHDTEECECEFCGKTFKNRSCLKYHHMLVHSSKRHSCEMCDKSYKSKKHLILHVDVIHKKILKYQCGICGKSFGISGNLKRHEQLHKNDLERRKFRCEICGDKYFTQKVMLVAHQKQYHTVSINGPITCHQCINQFEDSEALFKHNRKVGSSVQYKCAFCKNSFFTRCDLLCHSVKSHPSQELPYKCKICPIVCNSLKAVQAHSTTQHNIDIKKKSKNSKRSRRRELVMCDICGKELKRHSLRCHKLTHLDEKHTCKFCGATVSSRKYLLEHERRCENPGAIPARNRPKVERQECGICGKRIPKRKIKDHEARHLGEQETTLCPLCGNAYTNSYFQKHEKLCREGRIPKKKSEAIKNVLATLEAEKACETITVANSDGSRPPKIYKCIHCDKTFPCPARVKQHARIHTGERPFSCQLCGTSFVQEGNLIAHLKTHTGEKGFICEFCGREFALKANLKRHERIHTGGERRFKCPYCEKAFYDRAVLDTHVRLHTGEKPYSCTTCGRAFSDRSTWYKHQKNHK